FDDQNYVLKGEHTGKTFELGQTVKVKCAACDIIARTIDFAIDGMEPAQGHRDRGGKRFDKNGKKPFHQDNNGKPRKVNKSGNAFFPMRKGGNGSSHNNNGSRFGKGNNNGRGKH
ncbi:MAG: hypothetical protein PUE64_08180, partial [Firmicutes bacterium]|nr:hypothetical protein [Bacillota bacterium]